MLKNGIRVFIRLTAKTMVLAAAFFSAQTLAFANDNVSVKREISRLLDDGKFKDLEPIARKFLRDSENLYDKAFAFIALNVSLLSQNDFSGSFALIERILPLIEKIDNPSFQLAAKYQVSLSYRFIGLSDERRDHANDLLEQAEAANLPLWACLAKLELAYYYLDAAPQEFSDAVQTGRNTCERIAREKKQKTNNEKKILTAALYDFRFLQGKFLLFREEKKDLMKANKILDSLNAEYIPEADKLKRIYPIAPLTKSLLAESYRRLGELDNAIRLANDALRYTEENGIMLHASRAYETLYLSKKEQGDMAAALEYHEKLLRTRHHVTDIKTAGKIAFYQMRYRSAEKDREIADLSRENRILALEQQINRQQTRLTLVVTALALVLLLILAVLVLRLRRERASFAHRARHDGLTGAANHQHFMAATERALAHCRQVDKPLSIIVFDLDHFKRINDAHGHGVGDDVLRAVAEACRPVLRTDDLLGRLGGEEFAILLPGSTPEDATDIAERCREAITEIPVAAGLPVDALSASFGIAGLAAQEEPSLRHSELIARADQALYAAKNAGRNRIDLYDTAAA
ncbi:GGDEF domain-containing protein [Rhodothalassium salexigens]|nr:GGDEF domain-containing protein [Rhodothalassium salexigens]MBB4211233.1 diguanylate cyclase (GGDEF)-like protein [Rhodothalassium salexigens DSM 2132]MBK1639327.1 hypothetical protein [Rhodothalassium salexigens DSM 2132]